MSGNKPSTSSRSAPALRGSTLLITNCTKVVGLGIAVHEMVIRANARQSVVAFCALTVIGAQVAQSVAIHFIDRMFTRDAEE